MPCRTQSCVRCKSLPSDKMDSQTKNIIVIWQAAWYELDQAIKLGLKDTFWLTEKRGILKFHTGFSDDKGIEKIEGEILKIRHRTIGEVNEIDTEDYNL